jgi:hypothetical protein
MNGKQVHGKGTSPSQKRTVSPLAQYRVTIIGLGGVGRQVAMQFAALGVPWLQLVDARAVTRATHRAEGYAYEDIGRLKVHATAQACHQLHPKLEVHTLPKRSVQGLDLGDAVFLCPTSATILRSLGPSTGGQSTVVVQCDAEGTFVPVAVATNVESLPDVPGPVGQSAGKSTARRSPLVPVYAATVAAGLAVAEFVRFAVGHQPPRTIRLDLEKLTLETRELM